MTPDEMQELEGVVRYAARQAAGSMLDFDDAAQVAWVAILESWDDYDPSRASRKTYAQRAAVGAVRDAANAYSSSLTVRKTVMKQYRKAVTECGSAGLAYERASEFGMTPETFYAAHVALTGTRSFDADNSVEDAYSGDSEEGLALEEQVQIEWYLDPDVSVWEAAESLSDKQHEAIVLWSQGLSTVEIGERLGITKQSASERVTGALSVLRNFYAQP